ncbi:hypothetical protein IWX65_002989 [Arthrobacter sp. CAN_A214]
MQRGESWERRPFRTFAGKALQATIADSRVSSVDEVFTRLDYREAIAINIVSCSDSTGDQDNEWYELALKESFAALWPERVKSRVLV